MLITLIMFKASRCRYFQKRLLNRNMIWMGKLDGIPISFIGVLGFQILEIWLKELAWMIG